APSPQQSPRQTKTTLDRVRGLVTAILFVFLIALPTRATAAAAWVTNGPTGGQIRSLAVDATSADTVYAGTYGAYVFKSVDAATTWTSKNVGFTDLFGIINDIAIVSPSTLYVATQYNGVYESTDAGESWTPRQGGLPFDIVLFSIAVDPTTPTTLY